VLLLWVVQLALLINFTAGQALLSTGRRGQSIGFGGA